MVPLSGADSVPQRADLRPMPWCVRAHVHGHPFGAPPQVEVPGPPQGVVPCGGVADLGGPRPLPDGWALRPGRGTLGQHGLGCGLSEPRVPECPVTAVLPPWDALCIPRAVHPQNSFSATFRTVGPWPSPLGVVVGELLKPRFLGSKTLRVRGAGHSPPTPISSVGRIGTWISGVPDPDPPEEAAPRVALLPRPPSPTLPHPPPAQPACQGPGGRGPGGAPPRPSPTPPAGPPPRLSPPSTFRTSHRVRSSFNSTLFWGWEAVRRAGGEGLLPVAESGGLVGAFSATWLSPASLSLSRSPSPCLGPQAPVLSVLGWGREPPRAKSPRQCPGRSQGRLRLRVR